MLKKSFKLVLVILLPLLLSSCDSDVIVGKWFGTADSNEVTSGELVEFMADGRFSIKTRSRKKNQENGFTKYQYVMQEEGEYHIDYSQNPITIDLKGVISGKEYYLKGIYRVYSSNLVEISFAQTGEPRPTEFYRGKTMKLRKAYPAELDINNYWMK